MYITQYVKFSRSVTGKWSEKKKTSPIELVDGQMTKPASCVEVGLKKLWKILWESCLNSTNI